MPVGLLGVCASSPCRAPRSGTAPAQLGVFVLEVGRVEDSRCSHDASAASRVGWQGRCMSTLDASYSEPERETEVDRRTWTAGSDVAVCGGFLARIGVPRSPLACPVPNSEK
ncbi:hypothetical protein EXIGLDRAFT_727710 [Exidia glandulosa HHB12029]|uniref:Uncharacterized protein n=1 Tax=Exidia glandulosa HHB12029 TaxID=1314781 RepID=A0A165D8U5_EXIGL|nr:hypothetical protein EXIGLDRAFT_727710 [Exidia glandulosa HHB12029]